MIAPNSKYKKEMFVKFVSPKLSKENVQKIFTKNYTISSHVLSDSLECSKRKAALLSKKRCVRAKVFFKLPDMDKKCLELFKKRKLVDSAQFEAADLSLKAFRAETKALFKRCSHIQSFKVPSIAANLLPELQKWNKYIVNFRDLKNVMLPISLTTLKDFRIFDKFSNLSGLRSLDITIVRFSSNKLEQLLQTIGSLHKLERLALTVTAKYTEAHGKEQILSKHLGSLVCLKEFIFRFHIISLTNEREYFTDLFIFLSGLRHLSVLETFFEVTNPSNSFLILNFFRIISSFDRLKILNLNLGVNVEPSQAHEKMLGSLLLTHLKELKSIKIYASGSHDYFLIKTLALMAQNLEKLNVHGLKPTSEKEMLDFFNYLKPKNCLSTVCLDLKTSFEPKKLEELFDSLSKCKKLETLQIWNGSSQFTVSETTLDKISKSLKKMNKLKTLGIDIKIDIKNNSILKNLFKVIISLNTLQKLDLKVNTKTMCEIDVLILFPLITRLESLILTFENSFLASNQYFNLFKEIRSSQIGYYYMRFAQTVLESPNRLQVARIRQ